MAWISEIKGKRGTKYKAVVRRRPFPTQSQTFDRKGDAKRWASGVEAEMEAGRFRDQSISRRYTVSDLIDAYLADVLPHRKDQRTPSSHMKKWRELIGDYRLAELTPKRIIDAREKLKNDKPKGKQKSGPTLNRYLATLSKALSVAEREYGWIDSNPAKKVTKFPESKGREVFLAQEDAIRLIEVCKQSRNRYLPTIVLIAVSTGMRLGEITNLRWQDVDLEEGMLVIRDSKTGEGRAMTIIDSACKALGDIYPDDMVPSDLVFQGRVPGKPMDSTKAWQAARKRFGMPEVRLHDLRHTAASFLVADGRSLPEIADILGHKSTQTTMRYAHLSDRHKRPILKQTMGRIFDQPEKGATPAVRRQDTSE